MFPVILTINNPQYGKSKSRPALATWYVDFMIKVSDVGFRLSSVASAHQNRDLGSGLANVSFACDTEHRWYRNMDNISGIIHATDQIRECLVESFIQGSEVLTCIGSQSPLNQSPADTAINGNMK